MDIETIMTGAAILAVGVGIYYVAKRRDKNHGGSGSGYGGGGRERPGNRPDSK